MHWNVAPDALPGSAMFVRILDRWLDDCSEQCGENNTSYFGVELSRLQGMGKKSALPLLGLEPMTLG